MQRQALWGVDVHAQATVTFTAWSDQPVLLQPPAFSWRCCQALARHYCTASSAIACEPVSAQALRSRQR